jgi:hypothetical protein
MKALSPYMFSTLALVGFAVAGFTAVDVLGQAPVALPVQTAFAEFRLAGIGAQECARPYVALTFESGASAQLVMPRQRPRVAVGDAAPPRRACRRVHQVQHAGTVCRSTASKLSTTTSSTLDVKIMVSIVTRFGPLSFLHR